MGLNEESLYCALIKAIKITVQQRLIKKKAATKITVEFYNPLNIQKDFNIQKDPTVYTHTQDTTLDF